MKINPVFFSEIKMRMRGVRAPILMTVYFILLLGVFTLVYKSLGAGYSYMESRPRLEGMELLIPMFSVLVCMVYAVVVLLVPALNAGNIASEREKQTLDLLLLSRISAIKIILGKVFSNLVFVVFLLVLTLPLFAVVYLFGSIMILDIVKMILFMIITAYACASLGTFFSALVKKTAIATILAYVTLIVFYILTLVIGAYMIVLHERLTSSYDVYVPIIMRINPTFTIMELLSAASSNANPGADFMSDMMGDLNFSFFVFSSGFMLIFSPLLNIASAILIKPVKKFQFRA